MVLLWILGRQGAVDLYPFASLTSLATLSKSKLKRLRKRTIRPQSSTMDVAERTLLTFVGTTNGRLPRIPIYGRADDNAISSSFKENYSILPHSCSPIPVILPDGSPSISSHKALISLQRDSYSDSLDPIVYN